MQRYSVSDLQGKLVTSGRTFVEPKEDILYFNWSGSSVEFIFTGTHLNVSLRAACGYEIEGAPGDPNAPKRPTWPWLGIFLDDMPMPIRKFEIASPNETWMLIQTQQPQTHRIRLTKLTENYKTTLGILAFTMDGTFEPIEKPVKKRIEIVGDSITCGYGNLVKESNRHFHSADEDNWRAYGPMAAVKLGMEYSCVSISGITAVKHQGWMMPWAMEELYAYTDKVCQDTLGMELQCWDFAANRNDYVVVNLGTNDCFAMLFSPDKTEQDKFRDAYKAFLGNIRHLNGPDTQIICALGTMNYYLFHDIAEAVADYQRDSGDANVHVLRFKPIHPFDGLGADGHPSTETHTKMADELADFIRALSK